MSTNFMESLKSTLNEDFNVSVTENGAVGYRTTGKNLLDLNFAISSLRGKSAREISDRFAKAFYDDKMLAVKWLFYAGDVREGVGERNLFRVCMEWLANNHPEVAKAVVTLVPEYTRWDNLLVLLDTSLKDAVVEVIVKQLTEDMDNYKAKKSVSLCAKWMPSVNTSSKKTVRYAKTLVKALHINEASYRKMLAKLRAYIDVTEVKMSAKEWDKIDYSKVPSRANLIYNDAFLRNDEDRRRAYLGALEKGETKINSSVAFPHDILHKYLVSSGYWGRSNLKAYDAALEGMWKALPNYVKEDSKTLCVVDGSGSMTSTISGTKVSCLTVANALGLYFAERCSGPYKDTFITFSANPQLVNFSGLSSLRDRAAKAFQYNECSNTDIEKTFDLILQTAINNNLKQEDLPSNVLILSDMEFDGATGYGWHGTPKADARLFRVIANKFAQHGYKMPRLVFWNLNSRTGTIPVKENEMGVALVSGFSPAVVKMVLSGKLDPYECLLEQINSERYNKVEEALKTVKM